VHGPTLSKTYTHKLWRQPAPESRQPGKHSEARNFPGRGRHRPHAIPGSTCYRWCRSTRAFDGHVGVRNHRAGRASHGELECAGHARGLSHASVAAAALPLELIGRIAPTRTEGINLRGIFRFPVERYVDKILPSVAAEKTTVGRA
jgi:hypothetical protein